MYLISYYKNGFYCEEVLNFIVKADLIRFHKLRKSFEKGYIQDFSSRRI